MHGSSNSSHPLPASGVIRGGVHLFPVRVYYEDTDLSGIVYYANYLKFIERARSDLLALLGVDQRAAWEAGEGAYTVADVAIAYRAPARLADALVVASRPLAVGAASVRLEQTVTRDDTLIARATVRVGFISPEGRARRQPAAWRGLFANQFTDLEVR